MDIHNFQRRLERTLEQVKESYICEENKKAIYDFHNFCFSQGIGAAKIHRYVFDLHKVATFLNKDFVDWDRKDLQEIVTRIEKSDYAPDTKRGIRIAIKKFFKWLRNIEEKGVYPPEVKWISTTNKKEKQRLPEEILTEEEVVKMIEFCRSERDKAFIAALYESGCRISEILTIKLKDINS